MAMTIDSIKELINPGCLPPEIPVEKIKEPHKSYPRNKSIAQVLYQTAYLERWGSGVQRILEICKEYGVPEPEWKATPYEVTVTFWRGKNDTKDDTKELTERQNVILSLIRQDDTITIDEMIQKTGVSPITIKRDIDTLRKSGIISMEGGRKSGHWVILK